MLLKWHEVICLDNLYTCDRSNIYDLIWNPKFSFVLHDITQPFWIQVDEIYNLACPNSPANYQKNPVETTKTSVMGSVNMLELASRVKAKILLTSTSKIYWNIKDRPVKESEWWVVNSVWPRSCYSEGKRVAETLFMDYHNEYWVNIKIMRIFSTYWPNMQLNDWKLVSEFIIKALSNKNIEIYWDGSQIRCLQYIDDVIDWMMKLMKHPDFKWPVNIWNPNQFTIKEMVDIIFKLIPESKSKVIYKPIWWEYPEQIYYPKQVIADISLAQKELWREPKTSLEEGMKKTIDYFRSIKEIF